MFKSRKNHFLKHIKRNQNIQIILEIIQGRYLDLQMPKVNLFSWRLFTVNTFSVKSLPIGNEPYCIMKFFFTRTAVEIVYLVPRLIKKSVTQHNLIIISTAMLAYRYWIWLLFLSDNFSNVRG